MNEILAYYIRLVLNLLNTLPETEETKKIRRLSESIYGTLNGDYS